MVGAKCTTGQSWDDNRVHCLPTEMTKASIVPLSQRLLAPFSSAGFHADLHTTSHHRELIGSFDIAAA